MASEREFLWSAFRLGIVLCGVYDLLRIGRRLWPGGRLRVALEDLVYWGWVTVRVFLLLYRESDGTLRWFAVGGAFVGMFLYHCLIGRWVMRGAEAARAAVTAFWRKIRRKKITNVTKRD